MAFEPINIYSRRRDPLGVANLLKQIAFDVEITGPLSCWEQIVVSVRKGGWLRKSPRLTFSHNADAYEGNDWFQQTLGMQNYFSGFQDSPAKSEMLECIPTFQFVLAVPQNDLDIASDDERLRLVYAVCKHLDGVVFTPSALRDASGRVLLGAGGDYDADAVLPQLPGMEPVSTDEPADDEDDDNYREPVPPTADRVVRRALALAAVADRGLLEIEREEAADPEGHRSDLLAWIEAIGIGDELEPAEWQVLQRPVGRLESQPAINAVWRIEGATVLAWALELLPLPPDDEVVNAPDVWKVLGLCDTDRAQQIITAATLRSPEVLAEMRKHQLMFHWRMVSYRLRPGPLDFVEFSKDCWIGTFDIGQFRILKQDLAIGNSPIAEADQDELDKVGSIAAERHLAINWLMGSSEVYSETDTST